jgi:hypothetical protein
MSSRRTRRNRIKKERYVDDDEYVDKKVEKKTGKTDDDIKKNASEHLPGTVNATC